MSSELTTKPKDACLLESLNLKGRPVYHKTHPVEYIFLLEATSFGQRRRFHVQIPRFLSPLN